MSGNAIIRPVILSGGAGSRLWPLSRQEAPKQFHKLTGKRSLLQESVLRVQAEPEFAAPIILGAAAHEALIRRHLDDIGVTAERIILEPMAKNTAPAIAALAVERERTAPGEVLVVLPADHEIPDDQAFRRTLLAGARQGAGGRIVIFGVTPTRAETGYGYIEVGAPVDDVCSTVTAFREKPDAETAESYLAAGRYVWNAGIFMFRSDVMIAEMERHCPAILCAARDAVTNATHQSNGLLLHDASFAWSPADSIDYALMERTDKAAVAPMRCDWSDVGSWESIWELAEKNADGVAALGDGAHLVDCRNTLAASDGPTITAIGVDDLIIVASRDAVLVLPKGRAQDVKKIVSRLSDSEDGSRLL